MNHLFAGAFRSFEKIYHVGTLNPAHKAGVYVSSLEGRGLSISECPEEWRAIAKLGGSPTWQMHKANNRFLDFHSLTAANRATIAAWGLHNEWIREATVWVYEYFDEESECNRQMEFSSKDLAEAEMEDEHASIFEKATFSSLPKLTHHAGYEPEPMLVMDLLAVAFAEFVLEVDGVFWDEILDEASLSAPRGVIAPAKVSSWTIDIVG